jgi:hypothetical protein
MIRLLRETIHDICATNCPQMMHTRPFRMRIKIDPRAAPVGPFPGETSIFRAIFSPGDV